MLKPGSKKIVDSFPCTPDGNCFALVQDISEFTLKIHGPSAALFEPREIKIGGKDGLASCEDLTFLLKGYGVTVPVKFRLSDGSLVRGPPGIPIKLR